MKIEQVKNIIRAAKKPYVYLQLKKSNYESVELGSFECEICKPEETPEEKTERALQWLDNLIETNFSDGMMYVFSVVAKTTIKSNQGGVIGPIEFSFKSNDNELEENKTKGLAGFQFHPNTIKGMGYMTEAEVKVMLLQKDIESQNKEHERKIVELTKEYKDAIKTVEETANQWKPSDVNGIIDRLMGLAGLVMNKQVPLPAAPKAIAGDEKNEPDIKQIMLKKTLAKIEDLNPEEIQVLNQEIERFKESIIEFRQKQQEQKNNETSS